MITEKLGKIAITPKGQWVAGSYERLDLVTNAGSSYLSLKDGNVSELTVTADWMLVADKGDPFLYSDFTPKQIAELQQPATSAAGELTETVNSKMSDVDTAEGLRATAETSRQGNEAARVQAESNRNAAEALRLSAETTRGQNEQSRVTAEGLRVNAESTRQTNTATAIQNANNAATNANNAAANVKDGKSAYQIYTEQTTDNPVLTENQWGNLMTGILNVLNSI